MNVLCGFVFHSICKPYFLYLFDNELIKCVADFSVLLILMVGNHRTVPTDIFCLFPVVTGLCCCVSFKVML